MLRMRTGISLFVRNKHGTLIDVVCTILGARGATFVLIPSWQPV